MSTPEPYLELASHGDRWPENRRMHVMVYPNTPAESDACTAGSTVTRALRSAGQQLLGAGAVSHYRVARFPAGRDGHRYPRVGPEELLTGFRDYLQGAGAPFAERSWCERDDCRDLTEYRGVHLLVHGHGFGTNVASAEAADDCEHHGGGGFSRGVTAWTGAGDGTNEGLARNSAIQETVHQFVRAQAEGVQALICDADGDDEKASYEEHTLGRVDDTGAVTPMLTYHVEEHAGCRGTGGPWDGSYTPALTPATKLAVYRTATTQCRPQPGVPRRPGDDPPHLRQADR